MQYMHDTSSAGVKEGDVLAGKFRIERVLGAGGMGVVVAAQHLQLEEKVAIKFLLPEALENPEAVARFLREAKAAIRIKSEHVVRVSDVGTLDSGAPYMVMEYLEGGDLAQWLQQRGALPIEQATEFVLQALEAIAEAHGLGIVHRDLKPANLFCSMRSDGLLSIKVLDFGISKVRSLNATGSQMAMTAAASVMGSPFYMSPEQMRSSRDVDAGTDIWALGICLYELITGVTPFGGDTISEVCVKAATSQPPPMRELRPELPPELEGVILKCLAKDRNQRFRNVAELAAAILPFAPKRTRASVERISRIISAAGLAGTSLELPPASAQAVTGHPIHTEANWGQTKSRTRIGHVGLTGAVILLPVIALGVAAWVVLRGRSEVPAKAPTVVTVAPVAVAVPPPALEPVTAPARATAAVSADAVAIAAPTAASALAASSTPAVKSYASANLKSPAPTAPRHRPQSAVARPASAKPNGPIDPFASPH